MPTLYTHIASNERKTWLLMSVFFIVVILLGFVFSQALGDSKILYYAVGFSIVSSFISYWYSDKIVLTMSNAHPLTQESNLGSNVGQCYLTDPDTGAGVGKNTGKTFSNVMKPTRDVGPFLEITNALGFNAYQTAVSCPIAGVAGWGGAMGPAQFIPSTWKLFSARLKSILGYYANPWAPKDAFMASGLYLTDLGAVGDSVSAQNKAACKYYGSGGASCSYSKSVQTLKAKIQSNIDLLSN